jgi:phosphatidylglycerophosphate synthase
MELTNLLAPRPHVVPVGDNDVLIWGMTSRERLRRMAAAQGLPLSADETGTVLLANLDFVFAPGWLSNIAKWPGTVLTRDGVPVLAHVDSADRAEVADAILRGCPLPDRLKSIPFETYEGFVNEELRKRERPFVERLTPANVPVIERASYVGAYKGVTDVLTKYLWPEWAFALTKLAARVGLSPNGVTAIGTVLCVIATVAFWYGFFWTGLATGLVFMVLDTVDGKLARCTITSSKLGNAWDHGIDLVHPPFWWWAWATGCAAYGRPLTDRTFWLVIVAMLFGYVAQRIIEGVFILRAGMHIHVWRRFDSRFRLITARRNPNMVILFAFLLIQRPDWGIITVAYWTMISLVVHLVRLLQALVKWSGGEPITSWLD